MRTSLASLALVIATCFTPTFSADDIPRPKSRHQFAAAISKVQQGMPAAEVLALLGKPDDIRTEQDPGGISTTRTKEIWRYGTAGHLTTATLGQVYIDVRDRAQYVYGQGRPQVPETFDERELRRLLVALGNVPSYNAGSAYNPLRVIQAVNLLQPLGKKQALAVIEEWLRVSADMFDDEGRDGVFLVLRTLFDVPDDPGYMPDMFVGAPVVAQQDDRTILPRFPIALEDGIPLLVNPGYSLAGQAERPESHVKYFRKHGKLRNKPLVPTDRPVTTMERFLQSPRSPFGGKDRFYDKERGRRDLAEQLLRLLDTVYRVGPDDDGSLLPWGKEGAARREEILRGATDLKIRWDSAANQYVFADGSVLPPRESKLYRRETWRPSIPERDIEVVIERDSPKRVDIWVSESYEVGKPRDLAKVAVVDVREPDKSLVEFESGGNPGTDPFSSTEFRAGTKGGTTTWKPGYLAEGEEIRIEITIKDKKYTSAKYKP